MPAARLALRLFSLDLAFTVLEVGAALLILHRFFPCPRGLTLSAALLAALGACAWHLILRRRCAPLLRAVAAAGPALAQPVPAELRQPAYRATVLLGWRTLWWRVALFGGVFLVLAALSVLRFALPRGAWPLWAVLAGGLLPLCDTFRALLVERLVRAQLLRLRIDVPPLLRLRDQLDGQLTLAAMGTGAPALLAAGGLALFFVPLTPEQQLRALTLFPPVPLVLLLGWGAWLHRSTRPLARYLDLAIAPSTEGALAAPAALLRSSPGWRSSPGLLRPPPQPPPEIAAAAYRTGQLLPYLLGASKVLLWSLSALLLSLVGQHLWGVDPGSAVLLLGETLLVTLGAALYEVLWHRSILAPLLTDLAGRRGGHAMRNPLSLRTKMLVAFGTLTLFACGLSLFWSMMQYKTVTGRYVQRLNDLRLANLLGELRDHPARSLDELSRLLARKARRDLLLYHLPPGHDRGTGFAGEGQAPPLSAATWEALRSGRTGQLEQGPLSLSHALVPGLGVIAIGQSGASGGELDTETRVLIAFFVLLLFGSLGVVVLAAADLTRPIRALEQRAEAIARGDLDRPTTPVAVEADEVGRLCLAFEEMRRALSERFRSSAQINFALEAQVARRTKELERRNSELKDAVAALQAAQEELLHAEKMASMGRLVAGIAHEINNPVNAVVNTAGPLQEAIAELSDLLERAGADPRASVRAAAAEMRDMLRVIQRGARRTKEIVQALHNYSRGDEGQPGSVDVHRCLDESLDLLAHDLKQGVAVVRDYGAAAPVRGHAGQLQQVFMNLLTNAVQALLSTSGAEISIATRTDEGRVTVTIADNGPGIPKHVLPRIFDPFFTTKDVGQGSGLGLSIVHGIVARHGGTITVDSEVGRGTRMIVSLPTQA